MLSQQTPYTPPPGERISSMQPPKMSLQPISIDDAQYIEALAQRLMPRFSCGGAQWL